MTSRWIQLPPIARERLPNGLTLVVAERRSLPLVTVRLALRAGSSQDPADRPGLSAFTARLLSHGAGARDSRAFNEQLDALGGILGASIGLDQLVIDAEFTTATWPEGVRLFLDAVLRPRFEEAEVARERERAIAEVVQTHDDPDHVADRAFQRFVFERHPYGHPPEGTTSSLALMGREDVCRFKAQGLVPDGGALVIVGDVDPATEIARLRDALAGWAGRGSPPATPPDAEPATGSRVVLVHDAGAGQAQWRAGNVALRRATPLYHRIVLANAILGGAFSSRLMQEIRVERGLTYGIGTRFLLALARGTFTVSSFTKNATLVEMHEVAVRILDGLREGGARQDEIDSARAHVLGLHVQRLETPEGLAAALADAEVLGLGESSITGFRDGIEGVTLKALNESLPEILPDQLLTVVVGDADELREPCAEIGSVHEVEADFAEGMEL